MSRRRLAVQDAAEALVVQVDDLARQCGARHDLAGQMRRASASIAPTLAEGATEKLPREKVRIYRIARRSCEETESALRLARKLRLAAPEVVERLERDCRRVSWLVTRLMDSVESRT